MKHGTHQRLLKPTPLTRASGKYKCSILSEVFDFAFRCSPFVLLAILVTLVVLRSQHRAAPQVHPVVEVTFKGLENVEAIGISEAAHSGADKDDGGLLEGYNRDAIVLAEGDLSSRLYSVCAAYAFASLTRTPTVALWPSDAHMPHVRFHHLFSPPNIEADNTENGAEGGTAELSRGGGWRYLRVRDSAIASDDLKKGLSSNRRTVLLSPCESPEQQQQQQGNEEKARDGEAGKGAQGGSEEAGVAAFAVYMSPKGRRAEAAAGESSPEAAAAAGAAAAGGAAEGGSGEERAEAVMRRCEFEREVTRCLASLQPSADVGRLVEREDVESVQNTVALHLHDLPAPGCSGCAASADGSSAALCAMRRVAMESLKDPSLRFSLASPSPARAATVTSHFDPLRAPLLLRAGEERGKKCAFEQMGGVQGEGQGEGQGEEQRGREGGSGSGRRLNEESRGAAEGQRVARAGRDPILLCHQLRVSELFTLSRAQGFLPINSSSIEARFITAQGTARSAEFQVLPSVCGSQEIPPIPQQKWAKFTFVQEGLGMAYCGIPEAASTTWLQWIRAQSGLPYKDKEPLIRETGLHRLSANFTEREAVRLITRPGIFRFTFVRNPFTRALSAYLSKLAYTSSITSSTRHGIAQSPRQLWAKAFFRHVWQQYEAVRAPEGLVTFRAFLKLVEELLQRHRGQMNRHLAPQADICNLNGIKYDYVGRFERFKADAQRMAGEFGGQHMDVFEIDRSSHVVTNRSVVKFYNEEAVNLLIRNYKMDFHVPLNNIEYTLPKALEQFKNVSLA
ncbi:hypothetical protein CLOM_g2100 [Closterium sp. NIES-68]|nr:hypothetical protein CLOM_g2100 [Closterium sp. NIES-68]GJP71787.1 hypothetical protein CLOP_g2579 [Closterium sp. NIES-67]